MFDEFLISKKEIGSFKVGLKNPLGLSTEKVTQNPRSFNTTQIRNAIENISFIDIEEGILPELLLSTSNYLLKDFFLYMHQTGLYNRQLNLWRTLAGITKISFSRLQKGVLKKKVLDAYMIDFFIDPETSCINAVVDENYTDSQAKYSFKDFRVYLSKALLRSNLNRLKGVFYFFCGIPDETFLPNLKLITKSFDPISKYESRLPQNYDLRLNVINFRRDNEKYMFDHLYPEIKSIKSEESKV